jgi:hypothetical protein
LLLQGRQTYIYLLLAVLAILGLQAVLGSLSSNVIGRPDVSGLMKQEPANSILEAGFLSQLGQKLSDNVLNGPLDAEVLEVEMELNNILLSLRPIKEVLSTFLALNFPDEFRA